MASFHYAFKVKGIESTRHFYVDILGCKEGWSSETWIDFDFFDEFSLDFNPSELAPFDSVETLFEEFVDTDTMFNFD